MEFFNSNWSNSGNKINVSFPIAKVNKEKRTVSGFATLNNVDRHGDIVTPDASEKAFQRFRGNLREMHQPLAVGKVVSFKPQQYIDKESGNTYEGIFVDAYISKGAQDTWEKVLDGTLTGFSIGGNIVQASYDDNDNPDNRIIKDYELMELSLVDSPANPLANIFSIQKSEDGSMQMMGMAPETHIENVFWCPVDQVATTSDDDSNNCVICGDSMNNVGWVEKSDSNKQETIAKLIDSYFQKDDAPGPTHSATTHEGDTANVMDSNQTVNLYPDQNDDVVSKKIDNNNKGTSLRKGGNQEMGDTLEADNVNEVAEEAVEEVPGVEDEAVEKAVSVSELPDDELDFTKALSKIEKKLTKVLAKNYADQAATVQQMYDAVTASTKGVEKSLEDYDTKNTELSGNVADIFQKFSDFEKSINDRLDDFDKRISALDNASAIRKSAELEGSTDNNKITKSIWGGHFLGADSL
jgi:HK97 family phage prohead protease